MQRRISCTAARGCFIHGDCLLPFRRCRGGPGGSGEQRQIRAVTGFFVRGEDGGPNPGCGWRARPAPDRGSWSPGCSPSPPLQVVRFVTPCRATTRPGVVVLCPSLRRTDTGAGPRLDFAPPATLSRRPSATAVQEGVQAAESVSRSVHASAFQIISSAADSKPRSEPLPLARIDRVTDLDLAPPVVSCPITPAGSESSSTLSWSAPSLHLTLSPSCSSSLQSTGPISRSAWPSHRLRFGKWRPTACRLSHPSSTPHIIPSPHGCHVVRRLLHFPACPLVLAGSSAG